MKVKTLKAHCNAYGHPYEKRKGIIYNHPDPTALIQAGLVSDYNEDGRRARPAKGVDGPEGDDSKGRRATSSKKSG